jgi:hypothetical protein
VLPAISGGAMSHGQRCCHGLVAVLPWRTEVLQGAGAVILLARVNMLPAVCVEADLVNRVSVVVVLAR